MDAQIGVFKLWTTSKVGVTLEINRAGRPEKFTDWQDTGNPRTIGTLHHEWPYV